MAAGKPDFYHPQVTVVVPKGTAVGNPVVVSLARGLVVLDEITVRVPPGPAGNVGWRVLVAQQQIIPWGGDPSWVIGDGEVMPFQVGLEVDSQVVFQAYNTDVFQHSLYVRTTYHDLDLGQPSPVVPILPVASIDEAGLGRA